MNGAGGAADPFAAYDGAYVLGALSPGERAAYEEHLRGCAACARAVRELAGLPGLLGRADPAAPAAGEEAPPASLLPALLSRVASQRRRRRVAALAGAAAVALAACLALVFTASLGNGGDDPAGSAPASAMTPLGAYPVRATISLTDAERGTRVEMECVYGGDRAGDYVLVAVDRDGRAEELARWRALPADTATLAVGAPLRRADIASLEVRTLGGYAVLRMTL